MQMPRSPFALRGCLAALMTLCWIATVNAEDDPFEDARSVFVQAYARAGVAGTDADAGDSEQLRTYALYPYLQSARIRGALAASNVPFDAVDQRAAAFLEYYGGEPVARDLRRSWLESLAKRAQWNTFLQYYNDASAGDDMRCRSFDARIATGRTENLAADIARQWLTPQSLPECEQAFDWLRSNGGLTATLIEQRARLALSKGNAAFARQIVDQLPAQRAVPLRQWASMLDNPQRGIDALIASPSTPVEREALLAAWSMLARRDRQGGIARYDALIAARKLDEAEASPYALALALPLSWDRDPAALTYFAKVQPDHFDDTALEWQARAAMWSEDWTLVARSIAAMSEATRQTARWRYWMARAAEQAHDKTLAQQLYKAVLDDDNYYAAMAAARLDRPVTPHPEKVTADKRAMHEIEQLPAFVRARELLRASLRREAFAEWQFGFDSLGEAARPQTVHIAMKWNWYDQAVATATQLRIFNDYSLLYPRPYDREVRAAAKLTDVDQTLIYGVLRQESLYRSDAVSSAGAYGLLQLLPATARTTAQKLKRPRPSTTDLFDPSVNVSLGAGQLRILLDRFGGQTAVALAGYNAGPAAAARWLPSQAVDPDIWIENIPYNETRGYVQRVLWHSLVFAWLRTGDAQRTDAWLARIGSPDDPAVLGSSGE